MWGCSPGEKHLRRFQILLRGDSTTRANNCQFVFARIKLLQHKLGRQARWVCPVRERAPKRYNSQCLRQSDIWGGCGVTKIESKIVAVPAPVWFSVDLESIL
jgi:hypothetical protein